MRFLTPVKLPPVRSAIGFDSLPGFTGRACWLVSGLACCFRLLAAGSWVSARCGNLAIFLLSVSRTGDSHSDIGSGTH